MTQHIKIMYSYLQDNPHVGILSGISSAIILEMRSLLTDEQVLKIVSGVGVWAGCGVACLSIICWAFKTFDILKDRYQKFKARKNEKIV